MKKKETRSKIPIKVVYIEGQLIKRVVDKITKETMYKKYKIWTNYT